MNRTTGEETRGERKEVFPKSAGVCLLVEREEFTAIKALPLGSQLHASP